jgi:hypothetical protein
MFSQRLPSTLGEGCYYQILQLVRQGSFEDDISADQDLNKDHITSPQFGIQTACTGLEIHLLYATEPTIFVSALTQCAK